MNTTRSGEDWEDEIDLDTNLDLDGRLNGVKGRVIKQSVDAQNPPEMVDNNSADPASDDEI